MWAAWGVCKWTEVDLVDRSGPKWTKFGRRGDRSFTDLLFAICYLSFVLRCKRSALGVTEEGAEAF